METQLRFLLSHVKLGVQKRFQIWFGKKFLSVHESETLLVDIVRFVCCAHHPPNSIILSDIIPRWAVIGWLLNCCSKNYVAANAKLALFYDWLFYDERVDSIMNIEPAILLMVNSIPRYVDLTQNLLDFLFLLMDHYDVERRNMILKGVSSAFDVLVRKGVVQSLGALTSSAVLSPFLKDRLLKLQSLSIPTVPTSQLPVPVSGKASESSCLLLKTNDIEMNSIESLVQNLGKAFRTSRAKGLGILDKILLSLMNLDDQIIKTVSVLELEALSRKLLKEFEFSDEKLFDISGSEEMQSATGLIIRYFLFSQCLMIRDMFLHWSRNEFLVGPCLLSYTSRLAHELHFMGSLHNASEPTNSLLSFHIQQYHLYTSSKKKGCPKAGDSTSKLNDKLVTELLEGAFAAYRSFLVHLENLDEGLDKSVSVLLCSDLITYTKRGGKNLRFLIHGVFSHLPDLSVSREDIVRLLLGQLDDSDLLDIQLEMGLKRLSIFSQDDEAIVLLIRCSFAWNSIEQRKFWSLIRSELAVSNVRTRRINDFSARK